MWISRYFVFFIIYSFMGWVFETIYTTVKSARWNNRGFLYGPVCPVYGTGGIAITAVTDLLCREILEYSYTWQEVFLVSFFGSIILEYFTSWALEKLFHAYWWDYSGKFLNIKGRVCFPCSIGFGCAGLLVTYVIAPAVEHLTAWISPSGYEILSLFFMGVLSVDITLTVSALTRFEKEFILLDKNINMHLEQFVENIVERTNPVLAIVTERPSAKELPAGKKTSFTARIAEEKERFTQESIENILHSMGSMSKSTLRRVKGFKKPSRADTRNLEAALARLKGHIKRNEKNN